MKNNNCECRSLCSKFKRISQEVLTRKPLSTDKSQQHPNIIQLQIFFLVSYKNASDIHLNYSYNKAGLDINVCLIPVKTDIGQVDLVSQLSDGTSEKMTVLPFEDYFL